MSTFHAQVYNLYKLHKGPNISKKAFLVLTNVLTHVGRRLTESSSSPNTPVLSFQDTKKEFANLFRGELKAQTWAWTKKAFRQYKQCPRNQPHISRQATRALFPNLSPTALLLLASILEFLAVQLIEHLRVLASELGWATILPRHVRLVMAHDDELRHLLRNQTVLFFTSAPAKGNPKPKHTSLTTLGEMEGFLETHATKIKAILKKHFTRKQFFISFHPDTCMANTQGLDKLFRYLHTKAEICLAASNVCGLIFQKFGYLYLAP